MVNINHYVVCHWNVIMIMIIIVIIIIIIMFKD